MKTTTAGLAALMLTATAALADPATGMWRTEPGDTGGYLHVSVYECGSSICGAIRKAVDANGQPVADYEHLNKRMIWDMAAKGGGTYSGGKIWAPDSGKTYSSKMQLSGSTLTVEGCVFGICRGQNWTRLQ